MVKEAFGPRINMPLSEWKECGKKWHLKQEEILKDMKINDTISKKPSKKNKKSKKNMIQEDDNRINIKKGLKFFKYDDNGEPI